MSLSRMLQAVETHSGEPMRVITGLASQGVLVLVITHDPDRRGLCTGLPVGTPAEPQAVQAGRHHLRLPPLE